MTFNGEIMRAYFISFLVLVSFLFLPAAGQTQGLGALLLDSTPTTSQSSSDIDLIMRKAAENGFQNPWRPLSGVRGMPLHR